MWGWLKSVFPGKPDVTHPHDRTLVRAIAAGIRTRTGARRNRVLHAYVKSHSPSIAGTRAMVASGVPVDAINHDGDTPFLIAVRTGKEPLARTLAELGANVNHTNHRDRSALHEAAEHGALNMVKLCMTYRARLEVQDKLGNTPLHLAAAQAYSPVIEFLIRSGARPDVTNQASQTAFAVAPEPLRRQMTTWWLETTSRMLVKKHQPPSTR
ncbi:MAG TPA: ankyrin repeat domain-containing protein [Gammaproteobacteria bacterium]|nr:ankyrin repeat domain-containing protein [Gammaproteobacteria bacterium]